MQAADLPDLASTTGPRRRAAPLNPTVPLFGVPLAVTDYETVLGHVDAWLTERHDRPLAMDAANTMTLAGSCVDERLRSCLHQYDMVLPDGRPLVWFMNQHGAGLSDVVSGPHLGPRILAGLNRPTKIALIGGMREEHQAIAEYSRERFPKADFVLFQEIPAGPIDDELVRRSVELIETSGAELVFVLLGVPRQYYWVGLAKPRLGARVCMSIGGGFNFMTGRYAYAPSWMQRAGLWWLHRALREPRRLIPRYVKYNTMFLWFLLTREVLSLGPGGRRSGPATDGRAGRRR